MTQNRTNTLNPVIQIVSTSITSVVDCTSVIPRDDSIPQNTEGTQVFTLAITPKLSTSKLRIFFSGFGTNNSGSAQTVVALFQDSTANALAAVSIRPQASNGCTLELQHNMTSGTTSSTTFAIRAGCGAAAAHFYVNGNASGTQLMGGVASTTMTIVEYRA